ncbi:preprotein translocase, partial [Klebsiella quasipneumoniae]|nr:preprotein translocase [Klebsiella quasipneumoniae]
KYDVLEKGQLPAFITAVQGLSNPTIAAYIQAMLLTGEMQGELLALKWTDVNGKWQSITIRDKDASKGGFEGTRTIPLTP